MAIEKDVSIPASVEKDSFRTTRVIIETPDGGPYRLRFEREKIVKNSAGAEQKRIPLNFQSAREFSPDGAGMTDQEKKIMGGIQAAIDGYAAADGEN